MVCLLLRCQIALVLLKARHLGLVLALVILSLSVVSGDPSVLMVVVVSQVVQLQFRISLLVIVREDVVADNYSNGIRGAERISF